MFNSSWLQSNDYSLLIGIDFRFIILNFPCKMAAPLLLILVHTSAENFERRKTIRETWGFRNGHVMTLFMLGDSKSSLVNKGVCTENDIFGDIIQGNFIEDYYNLSYKHAMSLKYTLYHCPRAKYILRVDDDVLVNTPELVDFLKTNLSKYGSEKCLICSLKTNAPVVRTYRSKWRISFDDYPGRYYPPYCQGWYVLYSPDVIFQLYKELQRHRFFKMEDVLVTGMVADKIKYANHSDSTQLAYVYHHFKFRPNYFLFGGYDWDTEYIRKLWTTLTRSERKQLRID